MKEKDFLKKLTDGIPVGIEPKYAVHILSVCFEWFVKSLYEMGYEIIKKKEEK